MYVELNRKAASRRRCTRHPDVEVETILVLRIDDGRGGVRIGDSGGSVPIDWLWTDGTKVGVVGI